MKTIFLALVLVAGTLFAKAQTTWLNIQSGNPCDVHYRLFASFCDDPQRVVMSDSEFVAFPGENAIRTFTGTVWAGGVFFGMGIVGMRVYSDDPSCSSRTSVDVFAPVSGPILPPGSPVFPTCTPCPPIYTFFEIYCSSANNIFRFS